MKIVSLGIRKKGLYAVEFDRPIDLEAEREKENVLLIYRDTFDLKGYRVGSCLSEKELEELCLCSVCDRAYSKGLWLLNYRDYSKKAIKEKLMPEFGEAGAEYAAARLVHFGIIDDERYAKRLAEILITNKQTPKKQAVYKMVAKGIDKSLAESICDEVEVDVSAQLEEIIRKKYISRLSTPEQIKKVTSALLRRGFDYYDIKSALSRYDSEGEW